MIMKVMVCAMVTEVVVSSHYLFGWRCNSHHYHTSHPLFLSIYVEGIVLTVSMSIRRHHMSYIEFGTSLNSDLESDEQEFLRIKEIGRIVSD